MKENSSWCNYIGWTSFYDSFTYLKNYRVHCIRTVVEQFQNRVIIHTFCQKILGTVAGNILDHTIQVCSMIYLYGMVLVPDFDEPQSTAQLASLSHESI